MRVTRAACVSDLVVGRGLFPFREWYGAEGAVGVGQL